MSAQIDEPIARFADFAALAYHEGRNVRHLIKAKHLSHEGYERLVGLPTNRHEAWKDLLPQRAEAKIATSARAAEAVFQRRYGLRLEDLETVFRNPNWRHSKKKGGNQWARITRALMDLRDAIDRGDARAVSELLAMMPDMSHNTGVLGTKLRTLNSAID